MCTYDEMISAVAHTLPSGMMIAVGSKVEILHVERSGVFPGAVCHLFRPRVPGPPGPVTSGEPKTSQPGRDEGAQPQGSRAAASSSFHGSFNNLFVWYWLVKKP